MKETLTTGLTVIAAALLLAGCESGAQTISKKCESHGGVKSLTSNSSDVVAGVCNDGTVVEASKW